MANWKKDPLGVKAMERNARLRRFKHFGTEKPRDGWEFILSSGDKEYGRFARMCEAERLKRRLILSGISCRAWMICGQAKGVA